MLRQGTAVDKHNRPRLLKIVCLFSGCVGVGSYVIFFVDHRDTTSLSQGLPVCQNNAA